METTKEIYLLGASGHGKVIAEIAELSGWSVLAFIDDDLNKNKLLSYSVIHKIPEDKINIIISIGDNLIRKKIVKTNSNFRYPVLQHPHSILSKYAKVGVGTVLMGGVTINADTQIGQHCIINTNASIDHDCELGDFVHISPNASLAGNVKVGEGTHIGIGACIIQGVTIGKWCTIGAGAVIIRDVEDGATVVGNPGKVIALKN